MRLMTHQMFLLGALAAAMLVLSPAAFATTVADEAMQEGKLVSIIADKLVMTDAQGDNQVTLTVAGDLKVTRDGTMCPASELKPGMTIFVATASNDKNVATRIECGNKNRSRAGNCHEGKVVRVVGDNLVMTSKDGKEYSHKLCANAKVTLNGKTCKAAELKPGTRVRVTTPEADNNVASRLEGIDTERNFVNTSHDGKVVSVTGDKLVMTSTDGTEHSHALNADAKVTLDGKTCKLADLKAGTQIRVTTPQSDRNVASRVEGIEENPNFANDSHDGKVVSIMGDKLVMTSTEGERQAHALSSDIKMTLDGKICKATDLKPGTRIRVTLRSNEPQAPIQVEAFDRTSELTGSYSERK